MPGDVVTTRDPTITGFTDPGNQKVNVYWDYCNDGCKRLLGSATVNPTTGAWTFTSATGTKWNLGVNENSIEALGVLNGVEEPFIFANEVKFTFTPIVGTAEIHGTKWNDANNNGVRDPGELGVGGVRICLSELFPPDTTGVQIDCTTTLADGTYSFTQLPADFYKVQETAPLGASQTFPANGQPQFVQLGNAQILQGVDFGNTQVPPGAISGTKFNDANGNGVQDPGELGVQGISICIQPLYLCTTTDANGNYLFQNVLVGTFQVYENIGSSINTTPLSQTVTVVTGQTVQNVNFGNQAPTPPPPEVTIIGGTGNVINGLPVIHWQSTTTYTKDVTAHCGGADPTSIQLTIGPFADTPSLGTVSGAMSKVGSSKIWTATFGPFSPHHGTAALTFDVTCPGAVHEIQNGGDIYVDPSGTITDACTGLPILGATATISIEFPPSSGTFVTAPASTPPIIPPVNPETTLAVGMYGWDVFPGKYEVTAAATGYVSKTTAPVTVPPAVTGLDISLTPVAGCLVLPPVIIVLGANPATALLGSTYTDAGATATDSSGAVPVITTGTVDTSLIGTYTITYTATNTAGTTIATRTVNVVAVGTAGEVTGEGKIGKKTNLEFDVESVDGIKFGEHLAFTDKDKKIELESKTITLLDLSSDKTKSYFTGMAKLNDKSGYTFQVYANDNVDGTPDSFSITIKDSTGATVYTNTASLTDGKIEIHPDDDTHDKDKSDNGDKENNDKGNTDSKDKTNK